MKSIDPASTHADLAFPHTNPAIYGEDRANGHFHSVVARGWERTERRGRADDLAAALLVARRTSGGNSGDGEGRVRRRRVAEAGDGEPPVSPSRTTRGRV